MLRHIRSMRLPIVLSLGVMLAGAAEFPSARSSAPDPLRDLDECIQRRFVNIAPFGMSRVLPQGAHGVRQFHPETAKERDAVDQLEQQGYEVALYLAGREILDPAHTAADPRLEIFYPRRAVQGPAFITHLPSPRDLPKSAALLPDARTAMASFDAGQDYGVEKDGWHVWMRPLRATSQACVACHAHGPGGTIENLKIGDALGVVLYVSRWK